MLIRGVFQDQYEAGLLTNCVTSDCWLSESVNAEAVRVINSFYLSNKGLFNFNSTSLARIGVLFSAKSVNNSESSHWVVFKKLSKFLTSNHLQYDVLFSEDSRFSNNTLTLTKLKGYSLIILPYNEVLDESVASLIKDYLLSGGNVITIGVIDSKLVIPPGTNYYNLSDGLDLWTNVGIRWGEFRRAVVSDELLRRIKKLMGKQLLINHLPSSVGVQAWLNGGEVVIHLINYDFNLSQGVIEQDNITLLVSLNNKPSTIKLVSPDFNGVRVLSFNYSNGVAQLIIPELRVWDVVVIN